MNKPQLTYYSLGQQVVAFSTTRHGGCSEDRYGEFNINAYCGDSPAHVAANRQLLARLLEIPETHIVMPHQVHGVEVRRVDAPPHETIEGVDALMTDVPGLCIGVSTADCIPVLLYDPEHHAVCAIHAGWRGTVKRIVQTAVDKMNIVYKTNPSELRAIIGPGISLRNFEVGDEVFNLFLENHFDMDVVAQKYTKWHIDLPMCNRLQLKECGVKNIYMSKICTFEQCQDYFSARRLGINSGRIFTGIMVL